MSRDVLFVSPASEVGEVIDLRIDHRIGAVPVADADGDQLVGIVRYIDVLGELCRSL